MSFAAAYLHEPDLFPGRASGEVWGDAELRLDIAGGPYRLHGLSKSQAAALRAELPDRVLPGEAAGDVAVAVFRAPESDFRSFPTIGWQTAFDLSASISGVRFAGRRLCGRIELEPTVSAAFWTPADGADPELHGLVENFLRVLVAHQVLRLGGVLLHSAGVLVNGKAFVFIGHSGAGKSTLCSLSQGERFTILSDELNALVPTESGYQVERLPFAGDFGRTGGRRERFPLAGLFALAQGEPHAILPLARPRAVGALAACAPFVNDDPERDNQLFDNLERLTREAAISTLRFALDPGFWGILEP